MQAQVANTDDVAVSIKRDLSGEVNQVAYPNTLGQRKVIIPPPAWINVLHFVHAGEISWVVGLAEREARKVLVAVVSTVIVSDSIITP